MATFSLHDAKADKNKSICSKVSKRSLLWSTIVFTLMWLVLFMPLSIAVCMFAGGIYYQSDRLSKRINKARYPVEASRFETARLYSLYSMVISLIFFLIGLIFYFSALITVF